MGTIDECPPRGEVVQRPTEAAQEPRGSGPLPSTPARARGSSVRATPSLHPPRILKTISLFYRKEDPEKSRLRGRLQLFFLSLVWGFPIVAAGIPFVVDHFCEVGNPSRCQAWGSVYSRSVAELPYTVTRFCLLPPVGRAGRGFDGKHAAVGLACNDIDQRIRGTFEECKRNDQRLQRCCEGYERTHSLIHGEAEQKRQAGDRRDRVEGRIESLIQGRARSRGWDFSR